MLNLTKEKSVQKQNALLFLNWHPFRLGNRYITLFRVRFVNIEMSLLGVTDTICQ